MTKAMIAAMAMAGFTAANLKAQRMEKMFDARVDVFLDEVDARPEQRARVKEVTAQLKTDFAPLAKQGKATREELAEQFKAPVVDRVKVYGLIDAQLESVKGFAHKLADGLISVHDTLTPEQREKAAELRAQRE